MPVTVTVGAAEGRAGVAGPAVGIATYWPTWKSVGVVQVSVVEPAAIEHV
ncbi:MAG: hypothetical protein ACLQU2_36155 [Candidatus Binataceae bacterium]